MPRFGKPTRPARGTSAHRRSGGAARNSEILAGDRHVIRGRVSSILLAFMLVLACAFPAAGASVNAYADEQTNDSAQVQTDSNGASDDAAADVDADAAVDGTQEDPETSGVDEPVADASGDGTSQPVEPQDGSVAAPAAPAAVQSDQTADGPATTTAELAAAVAAAPTDGSACTVNVADGLVLDGAVNVPSGANVTLESASGTATASVQQGASVSIPAGATLTIQNLTLNGEGSTLNATLFYVEGTLNLGSGATIENIKANANIVYMSADDAVVNVDGATIVDNELNGDSYAVLHVSNGTVNIASGSLSGNSKVGCYGVLIYSEGTFNISGGTFDGNTNKSTGLVMGGCITLEGGSGTITGGSFTNNVTGDAYGTGTVYGGVIYVADHKPLRLGKTLVTGNWSSGIGGGIWTCPNGSTLSVSDNLAVFDNAAGPDGGNASVRGAGADLAICNSGSSGGSVISNVMLGGGKANWQKDGGMGSGRDYGGGSLIYVSDRSARFDPSQVGAPLFIKDNAKHALVNVASDSDKEKAKQSAEVIFSGNKVQSTHQAVGGAIAANGPLAFGSGPLPAFAQVDATKTLIDDDGLGKTLAAGEFTFEIRDESGAVVETATNEADGTVDFAPLEFDSAGTYHYIIAERDDGATGVTYDDAQKKITVEVTGEDNLSATLTYDEGAAPTFTNHFARTGSVQLTAKKLFKSADGASDVPLAADQFSFDLYEGDKAEGDPLATATNDAAGNVAFDELTYRLDDLGGAASKDYTYTVAERIPDGATDNGDGTFTGTDGVTYDGASHTYVVTVSYDGGDALAATVKSIDGVESTSEPAPTFTNKAAPEQPDEEQPTSEHPSEDQPSADGSAPEALAKTGDAPSLLLGLAALALIAAVSTITAGIIRRHN